MEDCWQAMCSICLGGWFGEHRPNSKLASSDAKKHNDEKHNGEKNASAVHSCAFPPSRLQEEKFGVPYRSNNNDLGRCVVTAKNSSCTCWDSITYGECEIKVRQWQIEFPNQYHSSQWFEGKKCEDIVSPKCIEPDKA